jgi:hypothetical protein
LLFWLTATKQLLKVFSFRYWKKAMDSQAMPEAIQSRIHPQSEKGIHFAKDFHVSGPPGGVNIGWTHHPPHPQKKIRKRGSFCQGFSC